VGKLSSRADGHYLQLDCDPDLPHHYCKGIHVLQVGLWIHVRVGTFSNPCLWFSLLNNTLCFWTEKTGGKQTTIPNSNVRKESTLEHWWFNHAHYFWKVPSVQTPLHSDSWVKTIETAKKHNEPKCVESSQALKATGSSSGQLFSCLWSLGHTDDFFLRHIHRGGTHLMCHVVPTKKFWDTVCLCWSSRWCYASFLDKWLIKIPIST
jgi:hypothetical protein